MWIGIRRVARHWRIVEIIPASGIWRTRHKVDRLIVLIGVIPRVTRLRCLLHPPRIVPAHRAYLRAEARLIERLNDLVNLVRIAGSKTLRMPLVNSERVAGV